MTKSEALYNFFDTILKGESKTYDDHNWYNNTGLKSFIKGTSKTPYSLLKKDLSSYTLEEIIEFQSNPRNATGQLWAVGRYQIIPTTFKELVKRLNLPLETKFSKEVQDKMGYSLLTQRSTIKNYIQGISPDTTENKQRAALSVAQIWSSVGVPYPVQGSKKYVDKNESYYSGGGDKASVTTEDAQKALTVLRKSHLEGFKLPSFSKPDSKLLPTIAITSAIVVSVYVLAVFTETGRKITKKLFSRN